MLTVAFIRHLVATIAALGFLSSPLLAQEAPLDPNRPGVAVLTGVPERELTDPGSLVSGPNPDAKPISVEDVLSLRTSWFATWTPDGNDVVFTSDLTGADEFVAVPACRRVSAAAASVRKQGILSGGVA